MGKIRGRGMPNILLFFSYHGGISHYGGKRDLSFTYIKFDIILHGFEDSNIAIL